MYSAKHTEGGGIRKLHARLLSEVWARLGSREPEIRRKCEVNLENGRKGRYTVSIEKKNMDRITDTRASLMRNWNEEKSKDIRIRWEAGAEAEDWMMD